jgi:hypothetical protein
MDREPPVPWDKLSEAQSQANRLPLSRAFLALVLFAVSVASCALAAAIYLDTHETVEPSTGPISFFIFFGLAAAWGGIALLLSARKPRP